MAECRVSAFPLIENISRYDVRVTRYDLSHLSREKVILVNY